MTPHRKYQIRLIFENDRKYFNMEKDMTIDSLEANFDPRIYGFSKEEEKYYIQLVTNFLDNRKESQQ